MEAKAEKLAILQDILGDSYRTGDEVLFFCPKCSYPKKKLSINVKKNKFKCWFCDYRGNLNRLVKQLGNRDQKATWASLSGIDYDLSTVNEDMFADPEQDEVFEHLDLPAEFVSLVRNNQTPLAKRALKYLLNDRKMTMQDIFRWRLGFVPTGQYRDRVVFPSFDATGRLNFFTGRSYSDSPLRYLNPKSSKNVVFNELYVNWDKPVTLVEGPFDMVVAGNSIPILGSSLDEHTRLFQVVARHETPIYLALDPDAEKMASRLINALLNYGVDIFKMDVTGKKDVGEMTPEEFVECKNSAKPMNSDTYLEYLIGKI